MASVAEQVLGERMARMVLSMVAEPADQVTGQVLAQVGGVETLRLLESDDPIPKMSRGGALLWRERLSARLDAGLLERVAQAEALGINTLIPADRDWPTGLNDLWLRAPYVLWVRGASSFLAGPLAERVTITGVRAATPYGMEMARGLAANLVGDERIVVAGGAFGVDAAVHRGALAEGGHTVAVLACGVDRAYPSAHRELLERIGDVGLLVSELPPGTTPTRERFLARGRLLASLSKVTVIPEAGTRSGALHVATQAHALGRLVAAVPGPVTSGASAGPHDLIQQKVAVMVRNARDVTALLNRDTAQGRSATGLGLEPVRHQSPRQERPTL